MSFSPPVVQSQRLLTPLYPHLTLCHLHDSSTHSSTHPQSLPFVISATAHIILCHLFYFLYPPLILCHLYFLLIPYLTPYPFCPLYAPLALSHLLYSSTHPYSVIYSTPLNAPRTRFISQQQHRAKRTISTQRTARPEARCFAPSGPMLLYSRLILSRVLFSCHAEHKPPTL